MPLRVAFFVHSFPETSETFILRQVTGLLDRGHAVDVFADVRPAPAPLHEEVAAYALPQRTRYLHAAQGRPSIRERWASVAALLRHRRFVLRYLSGPRAGLLRDLADLTRLQVIGGLPRYDVVHCHFGDIALRYRFAAALWRAPLVASFYGFDCSSYPRARGSQVYAPLFQRADAVTVLSRHMAARVQALGCPPSLLHTLRIGVDPERFRCGSRRAADPTRSVRLLTVARLAEKKGIDVALHALAGLVAGFPALRYDIVGDGPLRAELEQLTARLGLGERVRFHGVRDGEYVNDAICRADLFLLPSRTAADGDEEGTPTVLMEAASCELPVVSTFHAGIPEVVLDGETGVLVPENDVDALRDRLRDLILHPERWSAMGRAGRRHIEEHFDTRKLSEQLEKLYEALLDGSASDPAHAAAEAAATTAQSPPARAEESWRRPTS